MAHPAATIFGLTLALWVADVRFAPAPVPAAAPKADPACESGASATPPADADLEVVVCASRIK